MHSGRIWLWQNWSVGTKPPCTDRAIPPMWLMKDPNTSPAAEIGLALWKLEQSQREMVSALVWAQGIGVFLTAVVERVYAHK